MHSLPREIRENERERKDFIALALAITTQGAELGDEYWQERFAMRFRSRLINLVKTHIREVNRRRRNSKRTFLYGPRAEAILAATADEAGGELEDGEPDPDRLTRVVEAVESAIARIDHPRLRRVYRVSSIGELEIVEGLEREFCKQPETLRKYRDEARIRLSADPVLRAQLRDLGFSVKGKRRKGR
jgi:hypothetical protein